MHVFRTSNRIGIVSAKNVLDAEDKFMMAIPKEFLPQAHQWLVLHGRYICKARKPNCNGCIISDLCQFEEKNLD